FDPKYKSIVDNYLSNLKYEDPNDFITENNTKNITMGLQLQGVLNLLPNDEEDGRFQGVPGSHHKLNEWFKEAEEYLPSAKASGRYIFDYDRKPDRKFTVDAQRLPCPAGCLIIFDATLPHG